MKHLQNNSLAFRLALLQSERLRIFILLGSLAVILLFRTLRTLFAWSPENVKNFAAFTFLILSLAVFEIFVLKKIKRALRNSQPRLRKLLFLNILLELGLPALSIASAYSTSLIPEYRPLANPIFLFCFLLLTLSTLLLNPQLSAICGITAAVSYLAAAWFDGWRLASNNTSLFAPQQLVLTYAFSLVLGGFGAGIVANEIRRLVEAALREADTRREMEHLQHDLDVARTIQQSLLPKSMPQVAGWDLAAWNQPADQTGGDYYDWQPLPNGKFVAALGDVTGHGIGPALLAAVCRAYARANFRNHESFLKAMEEINSAVAADVREGRFITFVAVIFGPEDSSIELLSAGHAPLFLYKLSQDRFEKMEAHGLPLGITETFLSDPPHELRFAPGDILVLATDGFFEWANSAGNMFGADRLETSVRAARTLSAEEIINSLHEDVLKFAAGTKQKDDLTAIVLKRL